MRYLMVPGIGGSDDEHWQSHWERELGPAADRIEPASWDAPDQTNWLATIAKKSSAQSILVAHSLGCLAVTSWLTRATSPAALGAFLVAPPDRAGMTFPAAASSFSTALARMPVPTLVIASSNDPYGTRSTSKDLSIIWGASFIVAGPLGHINSASDLGQWGQGRSLLEAFTAGFKTR